ncbi:MAG: hypothetical protein KUG77_21710 [Nannocystaceae bacterium]|nr:hypothetical protein [Nannocystaceae bacterium]
MSDELPVLRPLWRLLHAAFVLTVVGFVVLPNIPSEDFPLAGTMAKWAKKVSFKQGWRMYAPNPTRAQMYMNLTAVYDDGSERRLEETDQENQAWGTHFMWNKTRVDIWRQYANFNAKRRNNNRVWYLKGVCVREARRGPIPKRIVMHMVRRRFTAPPKVAKGRSGLGRPKRTFVTVQYCQHPVVKQIIEADAGRQANGG